MFTLVPEEMLTMEMCVEYMGGHKRSGSTLAIKDIPKKFKTPEFYLKAAQTGTQISFVPDSFKTEELCLEALKAEYLNYEHIPKKMFTKEFTEKAMRLNPLLPRELCVVKDWKLFEFMPEDLMTVQVCGEIAWGTNGKVLGLIPEKIKTPKFYSFVAKNVKKLSHPKMPDEFWVDAIKKDGSLLEFVPKRQLESVTKKLGQ